ncbi:MAG: DUF4331 domain-containing protein [Actinomycetota bacterium]|nr:DUF4331 domain-containing protein [Actinomycetota bacterium]
MIAGEPEYDNTDVYAFVSPDRESTVTLVANWLPFEEPAGGPNFYKFAADGRYNIYVDNDGDARPDVTFRYTFKDHYRTQDTILYNTGVVTSLTDPDLNFYQTYTLQRINNDTGKVWTLARDYRVAPSYVGDASMPNYAALRSQAVRGTGEVRTFAGQAEDSFFIDLRVFDLLYGGDLSEVGDDTLAGFNVQTLALQVPKKMLAQYQNPSKFPVIGVWSTTDRRGADGDFHQVSRLGNPLVNELVIPIKDKDRFNASMPKNDAQFLESVTDPELAELIEAIYGIPAPETPREDLVSVFLTGIEGLNQPEDVTPSEQLRLNMSIPPAARPNRLGVIGGDIAGYPNGRRLTDDVIDISLQVVQGELVGNPNDLGDAVNRNDNPFGRTFPYVALPVSGSDPMPHPDSSGLTPLTGGRGVPSTPSSGPSGVPVVPISALALGMLALAGAGASVLRRPKVTSKVTAA